MSSIDWDTSFDWYPNEGRFTFFQLEYSWDEDGFQLIELVIFNLGFYLSFWPKDVD